MSLKYSFFLSICLYLFLLFYQFNYFLIFIFISILVILKTKDFKALFFIFSLFYFVVNPTKPTLPTFHEGKVIEIKENYIIVKNKQEKTSQEIRREMRETLEKSKIHNEKNKSKH